ncbi:MAG: hypothetical protein EP321_14275 [Sphingomonadales bacterium]|nr:MAG: hypothetical protein EP345_09415 [Sphingomonadales bacterium]TNF02256.1 MAG: hypothetical protein EP321_14275 [Sphingomonadales bacterium]
MAVMHFDPASLVEAGRVNHAVYTDPEIFDLEMKRIFGGTWVYVGHDSQVPGAGDYYATSIADQPVLLVRGKDQQLRLFYNRCTHKGAQLVNEGSGTVKAFRCAYHGWLFKDTGALHSIPAPGGYDCGTVCPGDGSHALEPVARFGSYRGFLFASLSPNVPELEQWLGPLRSSLDNFVDRAPAGRVEVAGGVLRYEHDCNWKFFVENTLDALHPMVVHQSAGRPAQILSARLDNQQKTNFVLQALAPFTGSYSFYDAMGGRVMPHGHADLGGKASIHSDYDEDPDYLAAMHAAYGPERTTEILSLSRNNSVAYPSLMFKAPIQLLRIIRPVAVDRTILETWHFRLVGAPESKLRRTIAYSTLVNSPAGMVGPDDHEVYRAMQRGLTARKPEWVEVSRYMADPEAVAGEDGAVPVKGTSDAYFRGQFSAWADLMGRP